MDIYFSTITFPAKTTGTDIDKIDRLLFSATGTTELVIGKSKFLDNLEIIIRITEIIHFLDSILLGLNPILMFQFEPIARTTCTADNYIISDLRGNFLAEISSSDAHVTLDKIIHFITSKIESFHPDLANSLISRDINAQLYGRLPQINFDKLD